MNAWGITTAVGLTAFFPLVLTAERLNLHRKFIAIRAKFARKHEPAPPVHVHVIDFHRSGLVITDRGALYGRCSVSACDEAVFIETNVSAAFKVAPPPVGKEQHAQLLKMWG